MLNKYSDLQRINDEIYRDSRKLGSQHEEIVHSIDRTINICENNQQIVL